MNGYLPLDVAYEEPSPDSVIRNRMDTWNERGLKGYLQMLIMKSLVLILGLERE